MGTAGHIDHGKTSLVRALTGIDCDRLDEEKRRGITIELGFAFFPLPNGERMGVVDVPGHERFVRNMVAGAAGIDFVLLVIAADEGVMPQTREHLEICSLLGIRHGMVALTKIDMVDPELLELAREDVSAFLQGTFLESAPVFPVSSQTGEGLDALRNAIYEQNTILAPKRRSDLFRLPVDRVFTLKGHGTVVTGTLISGSAKVGDEVELLPGQRASRIRSIQTHGADVTEAAPGHRTSLNLHGLEVTDIERGDVVALPGSLFPATRWLVSLTCLSSSPRALRHRAEIHFHHGAKEVPARLYFYDRERLAPGETALVEVRFSTPLAGVFGDRCVIRAFSPLRTVAGGEALIPLDSAPRRRDLSPELRARLLALASHTGTDDETLTVTQIELAGPTAQPKRPCPCSPIWSQNAWKKWCKACRAKGASPVTTRTAEPGSPPRPSTASWKTAWPARRIFTGANRSSPAWPRGCCSADWARICRPSWLTSYWSACSKPGLWWPKTI